MNSNYLIFTKKIKVSKLIIAYKIIDIFYYTETTINVMKINNKLLNNSLFFTIFN
jgi:hypothetical protein